MGEGNDSTNKVVFFLVGGAIGAAIALLFAPKSGAETRALIGDKAREGRDYLTNKSQELKEQAANYVDKGREVINSQKDRIASALEAGKQAYRDEKERAAQS